MKIATNIKIPRQGDAQKEVAMQNLKVIENELVPVYETSTGEKVVYGTELHSVLGVKSKFADWVKNRLNDCEAAENEDFQSFSKILEKGRPQMEYIIKLDTAKEMAMLERNDKGKQVRRYFIEVEKRYKSSASGKMEGLSPQLQLLINMELKQKEQDAKLTALEDKFSQHSEVLQTVKEAMTSAAHEKDLGKWVTECIGRIANSAAFEDNPYRYQCAWKESYDRLTSKAGCRLDTLLKHAKERAAQNGAPKSKINAISKLSVIADNRRLKELYISCIREMMAAYCIEDTE